MALALCPKCKKETDHQHLHETAHGIEGTHMSGSEHYKCTVCGHMIFADEGEPMGLRFPLDGAAARKR